MRPFVVEIVHCTGCGHATPRSPHTSLCLDCINAEEDAREDYKDFLADSDDASYDYQKEI